ncbi:hypothetical protein [Alkalihalobacillus sp. BA299]|uniref:hypothetical protein n=1 Tax=Alkalihalobacillus sp. BA299 TaxID=2815938 RepID=UPI001ADD5852|nr:hypothetical protein [Alkalihalobacillus sp. BA299]
MKKDKIRGVSIHTTGEGLAYYIHYDQNGTKHVSKQLYEEAITTLQKWDNLIDEKKIETRAIKL